MASSIGALSGIVEGDAALAPTDNPIEILNMERRSHCRNLKPFEELWLVIAQCVL